MDMEISLTPRAHVGEHEAGQTTMGHCEIVIRFISRLSRHGLRMILKPEVFIGYRVWTVRFEAILRCAVTGYS